MTVSERVVWSMLVGGALAVVSLAPGVRRDGPAAAHRTVPARAGEGGAGRAPRLTGRNREAPGRPDRRNGMAFRSLYPDVTIPETPLSSFTLARAGERGDKPALIDGPSGRTITYGQLPGLVARVAAGLAA